MHKHLMSTHELDMLGHKSMKAARHASLSQSYLKQLLGSLQTKMLNRNCKWLNYYW